MVYHHQSSIKSRLILFFHVPKSLQNVEAIDLIDHENKIIIQVSATSTKAKVESALEKDIIKEFPSYKFKFLSISKDASNLRKNKLKNPHDISFSPDSDILDVKSILNEVLQKDVMAQKDVYVFIKDELGNEVDVVKLDSNLAMIINILAKENWNDDCRSDPVHKFEIDRKISHNQLLKAKDLIEEYSLYHGKVDSKYSEFDSLGSNKRALFHFVWVIPLKIITPIRSPDHKMLCLS